MSFTVGVLAADDDEEIQSLVGSLRMAGVAASRVTLSSSSAVAVRTALATTDHEFVVIVSTDAVPRVRDVEYAIATLRDDATDVLIGAYDQIIYEDGSVAVHRPGRALRAALRRATDGCLARVPCGIVMGEVGALRMLASEMQGNDVRWEIELAWLARRYGLRADEFPMSLRALTGSVWKPNPLRLRLQRATLRRNAARGLYRTPRRCPVCFSMDVKTRDQVDGNVIRQCRRCKCRYLSRIPDPDAIERTRLLRLGRAREREEEFPRADAARQRTLDARAKRLARLLPARSRVLEVGARSGELGLRLRERFEYFGIELDPWSARTARMHGLDVFRASLTDFVNLGGGYDAVVMYDVIENLPQPQDAVAKLEELVRPGGQLVITTPDTESLTALVSGRRWSAHKVPEHIVLYSRSALVELLESSGFLIVSASADYRWFDHGRLRAALVRWPGWVRRVVSLALHILPDPFPSSSGCIRIVAKRASGPPVALRPVPSVEMSRAR